MGGQGALTKIYFHIIIYILFGRVYILTSKLLIGYIYLNWVYL